MSATVSQSSTLTPAGAERLADFSVAGGIDEGINFTIFVTDPAYVPVDLDGFLDDLKSALEGFGWVTSVTGTKYTLTQTSL